MLWLDCKLWNCISSENFGDKLETVEIGNPQFLLFQIVTTAVKSKTVLIISYIIL